jgi:hypothetical protein
MVRISQQLENCENRNDPEEMVGVCLRAVYCVLNVPIPDSPDF